ncbi:TatD family hydrolase [Halobellus captivus]|uniref:TatD family hydrolase n=1 Tax=Halobellus captivus TaxID=2592614 RepID=UPI0011A0A28D|nr:TatD family hydrolase [Halobellus captivus]
MTPGSPTHRPTDAAYPEADDVDLPTSLLNLPWIDSHNHAHTLSWSDRERYALSGCRAMVMVASGNHWTPYKPVRPADVRFLWDDAINRHRIIERNHFYEAKLAVGVQTGVRVEDARSLVDAMNDYCALEEVVAVGEIGIRQSQQVSAWALDEQMDVLEAQMDVAARHDLPVILHTPTRLNDDEHRRPGIGLHGYERNSSLSQAPVYEAENPELEAVKYDVEAANRAGLPESRIVASHADPNNVEYLMEQTDCYASFTIGAPWLTGVSPSTVAAAIREYGPDRIMIDTDCANVLRSDPFALKRAVFELYRLGVDESDIETVVFDTPKRMFDLDL